MLREEGLYDTQLSEWRRAAASGKASVKRGPVAKPADPNAAEVKALRRENMLLKRQLARSELVIDIQKKVASLLGIPLARIDEDGND
jgi:transposase-like protein